MSKAFYQTPFHIDHVIARKHGGSSAKDNLAYACFHCNTHKGPNIAGIDPNTGRLAPLFHPRADRWSRHFAWQGALVEGLTPTGRATVQALALNQPTLVAVRRSLQEEGHPFDAR
jgi:HNH endonuclease